MAGVLITGVACSVGWLLVKPLDLRCHYSTVPRQLRVLPLLPLAASRGDSNDGSHASDSSAAPGDEYVQPSHDALGGDDALANDDGGEFLESGVLLAGIADSSVLPMVASDVVPAPLQVPVLGSVPNVARQADTCLLTPRRNRLLLVPDPHPAPRPAHAVAFVVRQQSARSQESSLPAATAYPQSHGKLGKCHFVISTVPDKIHGKMSDILEYASDICV